MSHAYVCDYCGGPIEPDDPMLTISVRGATDTELFVNGWIGHYHGNRDCYDRVRDGIDLVQEYAGAIEAIPVATGQAIAAKRRKHRRA
jgi:hypothetical protein